MGLGWYIITGLISPTSAHCTILGFSGVVCRRVNLSLEMNRACKYDENEVIIFEFRATLGSEKHDGN